MRWENVEVSRDRIDLSTLMPARSISASTGTMGRSSVSYTVVMRSAARRAFRTIHNRSVTSASSAAYSVALSSGTWPNVLSDFLAPGACCSTCSKGMQMCPRCRSASTSMPWMPLGPASSA